MEDEEVDQISEQIAVSAIRYNLIKYDLDKAINFDIDDSLSLAGNSGPYVQYAHARAINVVKKSKSITFLANAELLTNDLELSLIRQLSKFEIMILETVKYVNPKLVAQYLYELADLFNTYYEKNSIMREKKVWIFQSQDWPDKSNTVNFSRISSLLRYDTSRQNVTSLVKVDYLKFCY
jgi:arginyl-tRNA synthetase